MRSPDAIAKPLPSVIDSGGLNILGTVLWFDADGRRELCFASSARLRRPGQHRKLVCTSSTWELFCLRDRRLSRRPRALTSPFGQPFRLGPETLELFPSGHLLGGAQVRVEHDGSFVLYCGTLCTSALPTVEAAQPVRADYVVAQARCLPSDADIPSRASVEGQIGDFVERTLSAGDTPVLLSEELGSAQDLLATLVRRGLPVAAHRSVSRYLSAYVDAGVSALKSVKKPARRLLPAHAFVCPPEFLGTELLRGMSGIRTAWVGLHAPQGVDEVFPLTNLSSAQDIVEHVRSCVPVRVLFVGPHDVRLAILAQQEGLDASALSRSGQLNLSIP